MELTQYLKSILIAQNLGIQKDGKIHTSVFRTWWKLFLLQFQRTLAELGGNESECQYYVIYVNTNVHTSISFIKKIHVYIYNLFLFYISTRSATLYLSVALCAQKTKQNRKNKKVAAEITYIYLFSFYFILHLAKWYLRWNLVSQLNHYIQL